MVVPVRVITHYCWEKLHCHATPLAGELGARARPLLGLPYVSMILDI